jgi:hypothetical protein
MENAALRHKANRLFVNPFPEDDVLGIHVRLKFGFLVNVEHLKLTRI